MKNVIFINAQHAHLPMFTLVTLVNHLLLLLKMVNNVYVLLVKAHIKILANLVRTTDVLSAPSTLELAINANHHLS